MLLDSYLDTFWTLEGRQITSQMKKKLWWRRSDSFVVIAVNNQIAEEIPGGMEEDHSTEESLWYLRDWGLPIVLTRQHNERVS